MRSSDANTCVGIGQRSSGAYAEWTKRACRLSRNRKGDATAGRGAFWTSAGERGAVEASRVDDHTVIRAGSKRAVERRQEAEGEAASALRGELEDRSTTVAIVACRVATAAGCAV